MAAAMEEFELGRKAEKEIGNKDRQISETLNARLQIRVSQKFMAASIRFSIDFHHLVRS